MKTLFLQFNSYDWKTKLTYYLPSERSFICCMQTSKAFKLQHGSCCSMMVNGSFRSFPQPCPFSSSVCPTDQPLFVALCTPTVNRVRRSDSHLCRSFDSVHSLDMSFIQLSDRYIQRSPLQTDNNKKQCSCAGYWQTFLCVSFSAFHIFWGIRQKKWRADRGTVLSTLKIFLRVQILIEV